MDVQIDPKYIRASVLSVVLFIVLLTSLAGFRAGRDLAKADVTLKQVDVLMKGLDYFYNDQDRYPSATEFEDKSALGTYVSSLPVLKYLKNNKKDVLVLARADRTAREMKKFAGSKFQ
jgi:hypothetical protein